MKKQKYIAPKTELVRLFDDLLTVQGESNFQIGDGSGEGNYGDIEDGDLDDGEEISAKHNHGWEDFGDKVNW